MNYTDQPRPYFSPLTHAYQVSSHYERLIDARINFIQAKVGALYCELRELEKLHMRDVD